MHEIGPHRVVCENAVYYLHAQNGQKCMEQWTLHTSNKHHIGIVAEML